MKNLIFVSILFICDLAWACPACAGALTNPNDKYISYVLMVFIALVYIPFYLLYRMIIKNRNTELEENQES